MLKWFLPPWLLGLALMGWRLVVLWRGDDWRAAVLWSVLVAAWAFGYWTVVTPIWTLIRLRSIWRLVKDAHARGQVPGADITAQDREFLTDQVVEMVSADSGIPKFIARRVVTMVARRLLQRIRANAAAGSLRQPPQPPLPPQPPRPPQPPS